MAADSYNNGKATEKHEEQKMLLLRLFIASVTRPVTQVPNGGSHTWYPNDKSPSVSAMSVRRSCCFYSPVSSVTLPRASHSKPPGHRNFESKRQICQLMRRFKSRVEPGWAFILAMQSAMSWNGWNSDSTAPNTHHRQQESNNITGETQRNSPPCSELWLIGRLDAEDLCAQSRSKFPRPLVSENPKRHRGNTLFWPCGPRVARTREGVFSSSFRCWMSRLGQET